MKGSLIKCLAGVLAVVVIAGCASSENAAPAPAAVTTPMQPAPGMGKMNVMIVVEDKRPVTRQVRYGSSNIERPEHYFTNTINLAGYTIDYLNNSRLFKSVSSTKTPGCYTLKLVWRSAHLNLNGWIPFVIRFQNHMTIDMSFIAPDGKVLWNYPLNGHVVNTPSSFRVFGTHRCDLFQQRVLNNHYPAAFRDLCMKLAQGVK